MSCDSQSFDPLGRLTAAGQAWLDTRLAESTAARQSLRQIDGKRFELVLEGLDIRIRLHAAGERLLLGDVGEADARLTATPIDALTLARNQSLADVKKTNAHLEGNVHVAEGFGQTLALLSPNPEAELAGWVGDVAAHEIVAAGRTVLRFIVDAERALERNSAEFLKEEQPTLARPWEVDELIEAIDDVRDAVERAATRLDALERARAGTADGPKPSTGPVPGGSAPVGPSLPADG
jgi:ubiquinone biosynthesis protein UbiJ